MAAAAGTVPRNSPSGASVRQLRLQLSDIPVVEGVAFPLLG